MISRSGKTPLKVGMQLDDLLLGVMFAIRRLEQSRQVDVVALPISNRKILLSAYASRSLSRRNHTSPVRHCSGISSMHVSLDAAVRIRAETKPLPFDGLIGKDVGFARSSFM
jgi:hypothetical protein